MRAFLWNLEAGNNIRCKLCLRKCLITDKNSLGYCKVRKKKGNNLIVTNYMKVAFYEDYIENLHLFHFKPFQKVLVINSFGTNCEYCSENVDKKELKKIDFEKFIEDVKSSGIKILFFYQQEPIIYFETMYKIAKYAFKAGLINVFSTNAYFLPTLSKLFRKYFSAVQVRIYNFLDEEFYREIGLEDIRNLKRTLLYLYRQKLHMEIVNFVNEKNKKENVFKFSEFLINNLSPSIPLHIIPKDFENFYELLELKELAERSGLRFVYLSEDRNVYCYNCKNLIIDRGNQKIYLNNALRCPYCLAKIEIIV